MDSGAMGDQADNIQHVQTPIPSLAEEEAIMKNYGGVMPKYPLLITKDTCFDSDDWVLGKQGKAPPCQKPRSLMETPRPKLQPSPHHAVPYRRSSLLADDGEGKGHVDGVGA